MKKLFAILTALSLFLWINGCAGDNHHGVTMGKAQIDALIAKELPIGTPRSKVIQFLDERKIDHTGHLASADPNSIGAMFREAEGSNSVVKTSIHVQFRFKDERLTSYSLSEKFTGP